uniref:Uncharacterized protein n=1 Tax=Nelumbo nucifera TaxID=4432 RepID=A0A822YL60_NELNU|nr:TPA_asm: hypothetical protein HUJ06_031556 [Nelumbo nucifera]
MVTDRVHSMFWSKQNGRRHYLADICNSTEHRQGIGYVLPEVRRRQSKMEIKDILVRYDRTLLVADPRHCEPKNFSGWGSRARF